MKIQDMRTIFMAVLFVMSLTTAKAQTYIPVCGMTDTTSIAKITPLPQAGLSIPSITPDSVYRVLVVWVRFADDNAVTSDWDYPTVFPTWATSMVDSVKANIDKDGKNISSYYFRNSFRRFNLVGNVRLVTPDSAEAFYHIYILYNINSVLITAV